MTPPHRNIATNNNHQAIARKIITVKSFGVGEGIINPSSYYSCEASRIYRRKGKAIRDTMSRHICGAIWATSENNSLDDVASSFVLIKPEETSPFFRATVRATPWSTWSDIIVIVSSTFRSRWGYYRLSDGVLWKPVKVVMIRFSAQGGRSWSLPESIPTNETSSFVHPLATMQPKRNRKNRKRIQSRVK